MKFLRKYDPPPAGLGVLLAVGFIAWLVWADASRAPAAAESSAYILTTQASYFDSPRWECASNDFAPGTLLEVTHAGRTIVVKVAGKGPFKNGLPHPTRGLDLSAPAFAALADPRAGVIDVTVDGRAGR